MKWLSVIGLILLSNGLFVIATIGLALLGVGLGMKYDTATALTIVGAILLTTSMLTVMRMKPNGR